jgi:GNAT superfamily N-acetyltransferase
MRPQLSPIDQHEPERTVSGQLMHELWDDSWQGAHAWQTRVDRAEASTSTYGHCEGTVLCDGREVGTFKRTLELRGDQLVAVHSNLVLDDMRGKGFARQWMQRCCERYEQEQVAQIHVQTGHDGLAVWPRMGFEPAGGVDAVLCELESQLVQLPLQQRMGAARELRELRAAPSPSAAQLVQDHPQLMAQLGPGAQVDLTAAPQDVALALQGGLSRPAATHGL